VVTADRQTAGKGRQGRAWESQAGNVFLSLLVHPKRPRREWATLSLLTGVALHQAIPQELQADCVLKWPNDLLLDEQKAAGILLESSDHWLVIGVGVNVQNSPAQDGMRYPVTCLADHGCAWPARQVQDAFLQKFYPLFQHWEANGVQSICAQWLDKSHAIGTPMRVHIGEDEVHGQFEGISPQGALKIRTDAGVRQIDVGDVVAIG
jgi:BirA family biotin operon repressor/biotin-[acetyl-CoA-carboxylase] ligase